MSGVFVIGLYIVYYIIFPLAFLIPLLAIWKNKEILRGISFFSFGREEEAHNLSKERVNSIRNLQIVLVVVLLLFMPLMNITSSTLQDSLIQREYGSAEGFRRGVLYNPVAKKIGPSYDTDSVIEEMENSPDYWHLENIRSQIDIEEITKLPGMLSVYYQDKMHWNYVLITYTYLSPIPITRVYGFRIIEEGEVAALRVAETVVYPMDPGRVDAF